LEIRRSSFALAFALHVALGCSSDETREERREYSDGIGRRCVATLQKTSANAQVVRKTTSCDGELKACNGDAKPCFQLSEHEQTRALLNCPACCQGKSSSFSSTECSELVCDSDAECVFESARCEQGRCVCTTNFCGG
jgi:hypothetical protein